jgi:hypothetical protein
MAYSKAPVMEKERHTAGQASPSRSARNRVDDRFDQRVGTASIHSIHSFDRKGDQAAGARRPLGRRTLRSLTRFVVAVVIGVGGTLAWQSYGDVAREIAATKSPTLGWLLSYVPTKLPAVAVSSNPAAQLPAAGFDALRRSVELLALRQEQMAQNIAALQAVGEDIRQKMSFTPPSVATALTQPPAPIPQQKPAARALVPLGR